MENDNVRKVQYIVPQQFVGKYLKDFLVSLGYSQDLIKHLKNTTNLDMFKILKFNEIINIEIIETENSENIVQNPNLPLYILYEDDDILVINKPAQIPIHPSQGNYDNTLGNALAYYFRNQNFVYRPITRLDKDTSGVCLIAKNRLSASILSTMIQNNTVKRTYIGIVKGNIYNIINLNNKLNSIKNINILINLDFIIDIPIKREEDSTIKRTISKDGEKAATKVTALKYIREKDISLCKFNLFTGRTHQIRVHMSHIGYPIIGDFLYNPDYTYINRQALHSNEIIILHPITHNLIRITSKIPNDIKSLI